MRSQTELAGMESTPKSKTTSLSSSVVAAPSNTTMKPASGMEERTQVELQLVSADYTLLALSPVVMCEHLPASHTSSPNKPSTREALLSRDLLTESPMSCALSLRPHLEIRGAQMHGSVRFM